MTWLKIDDGMPLHQKVLPLSDGAFRAHIEALCHCARAETDGHVTTALAKASRWVKRAPELVAAGLWETADGGWLIHDYLEFNPSRASLDEKREAARVRMNRARSSREQNANEHDPVRQPDPIRSDPSRSVEEIIPPQPSPLNGTYEALANLVTELCGFAAPSNRVSEQLLDWAKALTEDDVGRIRTEVGNVLADGVGRRGNAWRLIATIAGRVYVDRLAGRDPWAERAPDATRTSQAPVAIGAYSGRGGTRAMASAGGYIPTGDGARGGFSTVPPPA